MHMWLRPQRTEPHSMAHAMQQQPQQMAHSLAVTQQRYQHTPQQPAQAYDSRPYNTQPNQPQQPPPLSHSHGASSSFPNGPPRFYPLPSQPPPTAAQVHASMNAALASPAPSLSASFNGSASQGAGGLNLSSSLLRASDLGSSMRANTGAASPAPAAGFAPSSSSSFRATVVAPSHSSQQPSHQQQESYEARLHSLASTLLSRIVASVGSTPAAIGSMDASFHTLARSPESHPFLVARLGELLGETLAQEREVAFSQMQQALSAKDARLAALVAEFQQVSRAHTLKESLLAEQSELLKRELLAAKDAGEREHSLGASVVPRLQSQLSSLLVSDRERASLLDSLQSQLRERDAVLEQTLAKYESLSEQYMQLKSVTLSLNERLLEQGTALDAARGTQSGAVAASQAKVAAMQASLEVNQTRVRDLERSVEAAQAAQAKAEADAVARLEAERAALAKEFAASSAQASTLAAHAQEKLETELVSLQSSLDARVRTLEKNHATELRLRTEELQSRLDAANAEKKTLADALAKETQNREALARSSSGSVAESTAALVSLRDDHFRLSTSHDALQREHESLKAKYSSMGLTFESALAEDEAKFVSVVNAERARNAELKQRWTDDAARARREIAAMEARIKEAEGLAADHQRHTKSQADNLTQAAAREAELTRKLQEARLEASGVTASAKRTELELKAAVEKLTLDLRDREKVLDKTLLEREADAKRMGHELELRLLQAKQAFQLDKFASEKELAQSKAETVATRERMENAIAQARNVMEKERDQSIREVTASYEAKLAAALRDAPSQALFDAQLSQAIEARTVELQASMLTPEAHASILEQKIQSMRFEGERAAIALRAELDAKHAEALRAAEARSKEAAEALRTRFEAEYAQAMAQVKQGCREYEEELAAERRKVSEALERAESLSRSAKDAESSEKRARREAEDERVARNQMAEHLDQSSRVIDKLKAVLSQERTAAEEAKRAAPALVDEALRGQARDYEAALAALRADFAREQASLRSTFEQLLKQESEAARQKELVAEAEVTKARESAERQKQATQEAALASAALTQKTNIEVEALRAKLANAAADAAADQAALIARHNVAVDRVRADSQAEAERLLNEGRLALSRAEAAFDARVDTLRREADARVAEIERGFAAERAENKSLSARVTDLTTALAAAQRQFASIRALKATLDQSLASLRTDHASLQQSVRSDLTSLYGVSTSAITGMHGVLHEQRRRLEQQDVSLLDARTQQSFLQAALDEKESSLSDLMRSFEEEIATLKQQHALALQLQGSEFSKPLRDEIEALHARLASMAELHAAQVRQIKAENDEDYKSQLKHMEDLLRFRAGAMPSGSGATAQISLFSRGNPLTGSIAGSVAGGDTAEHSRAGSVFMGGSPSRSPSVPVPSATAAAGGSFFPSHLHSASRESRPASQQLAAAESTFFRSPSPAVPAASSSPLRDQPTSLPSHSRSGSFCPQQIGALSFPAVSATHARTGSLARATVPGEDSFPSSAHLRAASISRLAALSGAAGAGAPITQENFPAIASHLRAASIARSVAPTDATAHSRSVSLARSVAAAEDNFASFAPSRAGAPSSALAASADSHVSSPRLSSIGGGASEAGDSTAGGSSVGGMLHLMNSLAPRSEQKEDMQPPVSSLASASAAPSVTTHSRSVSSLLQRVEAAMAAQDSASAASAPIASPGHFVHQSLSSQAALEEFMRASAGVAETKQFAPNTEHQRTASSVSAADAIAMEAERYM